MSLFLTALRDVFSAFMILFAVVDITGSVPLIVSMIEKGQTYKASLAAFAGLLFFVLFFFLGKAILSFFSVDFQSFAVAGALVMLALAAEMIFDIRIFKDDAPTSNVTLVPLVFPLIAGPGAITTMLTLQAQPEFSGEHEFYGSVIILLAVAMNMGVVHLVLRKVRLVQRLLGKGGVYAMRKFFGIILLAVGVKMLLGNLALIIGQM